MAAGCGKNGGAGRIRQPTGYQAVQPGLGCPVRRIRIPNLTVTLLPVSARAAPPGLASATAEAKCGAQPGAGPDMPEIVLSPDDEKHPPLGERQPACI